MSISKAAIMLVVFVILFSVFVSNISNMISTVDLNYERTTTTPLEYNVSDFTLSNKEGLGSELRHLIWFIQISDLHISIFHDPTRIAELKEFCHLTLNAINPIIVLASGDLTDAKTADNIGSSQFVGEWQIYRKLLQDCGVQSKTVWLDIRGNHDNFNVPGLTSKENFYREYSVQGSSHPRSYMHQVARDNRTYSFIGVDACLEPGPRRPFNFIGVLSRAELAHLRGLAAEARRRGSTHEVWFGHYPTSCILSPGGTGIRELMGSGREGLAYLCGHFHTFGGVVPNMYTLQKAGFLELELGDWKDNRLYRVAAIDHGIFSFIDVKHRDWPVILVTNPKHSLFRMPLREPLQKIALSTHVRVLVFSLSPIKRVQVRVEAEDWRPCTHVEGPLYVAEWQSGLYARGVHHLEVYAVDDHNRERTLSQPFSLDETRTSFSILPRFALMCNISLVFQLVFGVTLVVSIVPLCILKFLHKVVRAGKCRKPRPPITVVRWWLRKLWILATVDRIFYPLVMYALYLTVDDYFPNSSHVTTGTRSGLQNKNIWHGETLSDC
ncbi:transmembrane protein 62-like isoform X2 [Bacillus rossius redtenbacheri]|uniref:transmembrane protein 62-like isoform X2 n=1 Tax=Bacillus rossius redtenbacheri TaxID=93214 RepID=UPI002FDDA6FC